MNKKTYNIFVIGCQMNKSDSERIAFLLESLGYFPQKDIYKADLAIITTCGVRQSAEDRIYGLVPALKRKNPAIKIVLTGCLSAEKIVQERLGDSVDIWLPIIDLDSLPALLGFKPENDSYERDYLRLKAKHETGFSAFVPIGNGCDNFCSYCYVPHARGRENYRDYQEIVRECSDLLEKGYREITLIAQNVNSYKSGEIFFPQLLKMVNNLDGDFWLRFATSHPKDMSDELIEAMADCDKLCRHIHLPAQAGDNEVLRRMNRKYSREHYLSLIEKTRKTLDRNADTEKDGLWIPPIAISTDIIVGFPGESKEQFEQTVRLFREVGFDMAYIAQYSPRPHTAAALMEETVSDEEKRRRDKKLNEVLAETGFKNNQLYQGRILQVLIDGKTKKGEWSGKTESSKTVVLPEEKNVEKGDIVKVKIKKARNFGLLAEVLR